MLDFLPVSAWCSLQNCCLYKKACIALSEAVARRRSVIKIVSEAVVWRCFVKKVFLEISQNLQENPCAGASFLIMLQACGLKLYQKRDPDTGAFLWILWNFWEHLFYRTPLVAASGVWKFPAAVTRRCTIKKMFIKFRKIRRKTPASESLLYKVVS